MGRALERLPQRLWSRSSQGAFERFWRELDACLAAWTPRLDEAVKVIGGASKVLALGIDEDFGGSVTQVLLEITFTSSCVACIDTGGKQQCQR